jgi:Protein of unknown function (DUF664)
VTGITSATPASNSSIGTSVAVSAGTYLLGWTATLQTAAAAEDANNFVLTAGGTLATSVNAGMVGRGSAADPSRREHEGAVRARCQDEGMRIDPDPAGPELVMLSQYLDYQRETILSKTDGLTRQQLAQQHPPSQLTLAGLLYHLALVEEDWMEVRFAGLPDREPWASVDWEADPDWEFRTAAQLEPEQLQSRYRQACERSRHVVSGAAGLDQLSARALRDGRHFALRWVLLHLIEETARHAGHADFLREALDGTVGE